MSGYVAWIWLPSTPADPRPARVIRPASDRAEALTWAREAHRAVPGGTSDYLVRGGGEVLTRMNGTERRYVDLGGDEPPLRPAPCTACAGPGRLAVRRDGRPDRWICDGCAARGVATLAALPSA